MFFFEFLGFDQFDVDPMRKALGMGSSCCMLFVGSLLVRFFQTLAAADAFEITSLRLLPLERRGGPARGGRVHDMVVFRVYIRRGRAGAVPYSPVSVQVIDSPGSYRFNGREVSVHQNLRADCGQHVRDYVVPESE